MKLLYVMERYNVVSELWMKRQISLLENHIVALVAENNMSKYHGRLPIVNLHWDVPIYKKILRKIKVMPSAHVTQEANANFIRILRRFKPNAILINYLTVAYELRESLREQTIPIFIQVHGYDVTWHYRSPENGSEIFSDDYRRFANSISSKVVFIANSQFTKQNLIGVGVPEEKIRVKYFGVPVHEPTQLREGDPFRILYIGRLVDCKAPDMVIKAFSMACDRGMRAQLIIAGDGYLKHSCLLEKYRSKYSEWISIIGSVSPEEGQKLRESCQIFTAHNCQGAITSQVESFGVSIVEAMAAGLPVVTGRSGGVVEIVRHNRTGFLFEPGNIREQAEYFLRLYNDSELRNRMGRLAREITEDVFSLEAERSQLLRILSIDE